MRTNHLPIAYHLPVLRIRQTVLMRTEPETVGDGFNVDIDAGTCVAK